MRRLAPVGVLTLLALLASGCGAPRSTLAGGGGTGTTITFSVAVPDEERGAIQQVLSRFQERSRTSVDPVLLSRYREQSPIRVNLVTSISASELVERLRSQSASGTPTVHLFAQDNLALKPLVDRGLVEDLSGVEVPRETLQAMLPPRFGGRQYFLPFRPNVRLTYLDGQRAEAAGVRAPATVEELEQVARRLREVSGRPRVTLSLAEGDPAAVTVSEWVLSFGGDPLVLNDEGSVRAFGVLQRLWREGLLARESLFARYDTEVLNLLRGTAWLAQNWSFTSAELAKHKMLDRFRVSAGWRGPARSAHVIGGDVLGLPRGLSGRQREAALELARYLMSEEAQSVLVRENAWPSIRDDAYASARPEQRQTFEAIEDAFEDGWYRPGVPYWSDVSDQMNAAVTRILLQQQPVRPVLDELHGRIEAAAAAKGAPYPPGPEP